MSAGATAWSSAREQLPMSWRLPIARLRQHQVVLAGADRPPREVGGPGPARLASATRPRWSATAAPAPRLPGLAAA